MDYKNITIAGCGVLGSQIAFQSAFKGFEVTIYDINDEALEHGKERITNLKQRYQEDLGASEEEVNFAYNQISFISELSKAVSNTDLVIEAIPEILKIKKDFYKELGKVAPKETIFVTNSSTFLPSQISKETGRPDKFLALHFANEIWKNNTAEIMKHQGTDTKVFLDVIEFSKAIGMIAFPIYKEQPGYIINSLIVPFLEAALVLLVKGIAEVVTIDATWEIATGALEGPFAILDLVGINTAYNIASAKADETGKPEYKMLVDFLKTEYIDKGKFGKEAGEGFYKYP